MRIAGLAPHGLGRRAALFEDGCERDRVLPQVSEQLAPLFRIARATQPVDAAHGRPLAAAGVDGIYAATAPDGRVMALLQDAGARTKSVVVIRPATL